MRSHHRIYLQNIVVSFIGQYRLFYRALLQKRPMMMMMMIDHHHLMMMYSQSHLGWHFRMLIQSSKLKARMFLFTETWQKRRSSPELWTFENVTPSGIGCIIILMKMMMIDHHHLLCDHDDMSSSNILMMMYHHLMMMYHHPDDDVSSSWWWWSIIIISCVTWSICCMSQLPIHCLTYQYTVSPTNTLDLLHVSTTNTLIDLLHVSHVMRPICIDL